MTRLRLMLPAAMVVAALTALTLMLPGVATSQAASEEAGMDLPAAHDAPGAYSGQVRTNALLNATLWTQYAAEYKALCHQAFNAARARLQEAVDDPEWTAAFEQGEGAGELPPAVVFDIDETVLDNSFYEARLILDEQTYSSSTWKGWSDEAQATAVPGALDFCRFCEEMGVKVVYITNRKENERAATAKNLRALGFPLDEDTSNLHLRTDTSNKTPRRTTVVEDYRILMLVGDSLGDHAGIFSKGTSEHRAAGVAEYQERWGERWIVLPNPCYGDWEGALFDYNWGWTDAQKQQAKYNALETMRAEALDEAKRGVNVPIQKHVADDVSLGAVAQRHQLISGGPMVGAVTYTQATIWLQTTAPADVQVRYWPVGEANKAKMSASLRADESSDHIALFTLRDLAYGTTYRYEPYINGSNGNLGYRAEFDTPNYWHYREQPPEFSFTLGSCSYKNDDAVDRISREGEIQKYGGDYEIFQAIAKDDADFMLWLGDNLYYRLPDWSSEGGMRARNRYDRSLAELQPLLADRAHFAIWDDHDFGPNNSNRSFALKEEAQEVFEDYWPNEGYGAGQDEGIYHSFTWGDCEFFMLDDRYFRGPEGDDQPMLGEAQLDWLKEALANSYATFKFIACGSQMINPIQLYEGFAKYPQEQEELLDYIETEEIGGVVFLSGDRHLTELLKVEREGSYPLYEYTSSPLGSGTYAGHESEQDNPARVPDTLVGDARNYGRISVTGSYGERVLTLKAFNKDGEELWSHTIEEAELKE